MAVREKVCKKTNAIYFEASVNQRSKSDSTIRIQKYKKCATLAEATKEEKKLLKIALRDIAAVEAKGNCWGKIIDLWEAQALRDLENPVTGVELTKKTVLNTASCLRNWTSDWLKIPAKEITKSHGRLIIKKAEQANMIKSSIRKIKCYIQTVHDFGIQEGIIDRTLLSPVFGVKIGVKDEDKIPEILTVDEVKTLLSRAKELNNRWFPHWAMALMTGMRTSELYALRKENVNLKDGLIRITESWDWEDSKAKSTKAGYWRNAPIAKALVPVIEKLMAETKGIYLLPRLEEWSKGEQAKHLRAFCEEIGITSIKFHTLRACFATHMLSSGVKEHIVMRIGGWSNYKTFQIYVRLAGVNEVGATEALGATLLPSDKKAFENVPDLIPSEEPKKIAA